MTTPTPAEVWQTGIFSAPALHHLGPILPGPWLTADDWPDLPALNAEAARQALHNAASQPIRFVAQTERCGQRDYELNIYASGEVPTRVRNWHDLFNALSWLSLPATKAALNDVQAAALRNTPHGPRGPQADAATLFDESGLVIAAPDPALGEALRARRWHEAFITHREAWAAAEVVIVGHAILEKLLKPWPGITAKCVFMPQPPAGGLDAALAAHWLTGQVTRPADLFPMPVLGVPGWWPANADPAFYDDREIFRPARPT